MLNMYSSFIRRKLINVEAEAVEKSAEGMPTALRAFFFPEKAQKCLLLCVHFQPEKRFFLLLLKSAEMPTALREFSWALFQPEKAHKSVLP